MLHLPEGDAMTRLSEIECCAVCGVEKEKAKYPNCGPDAKEAGVQLVGESFGPHVWVEAKKVEGYYGRSIPELMLSDWKELRGGKHGEAGK